MSSLLLTEVLHLFANIFRRRPPSRSIRGHQIATCATTTHPTPQVSNPIAAVVPSSGDHQHVDPDASHHCSPPQPRDATTTSTARAKTLPTSSISGFPDEVVISSRSSNYSERTCYKPHARDEKQQRIEGKAAALLRAFCYTQAVVIGEVPSPLPKGKVFVISPRVDVPPQCLHVCCELRPEEWPVALALTGFDWRQSTVWLLRMEYTSESTMLQQLKAVEMMSAPCSAVVLLSSSERVAQVVDGAGFRIDEAQTEKPLFLLRRKEQQARCVETHTPNITPQQSPPREPEQEWLLVRFELRVSSLPEEVRFGLGAGSIKVVGNRRELGEWNVEFGLRLVIAEDIGLAEVLVERGQTEYKYVYMDGRGSILWEDGGNRRLPCSNAVLLRLEDHWRRY